MKTWNLLFVLSLLALLIIGSIDRHTVRERLDFQSARLREMEDRVRVIEGLAAQLLFTKSSNTVWYTNFPAPPFKGQIRMMTIK